MLIAYKTMAVKNNFEPGPVTGHLLKLSATSCVFQLHKLYLLLSLLYYGKIIIIK